MKNIQSNYWHLKTAFLGASLVLFSPGLFVLATFILGDVDFSIFSDNGILILSIIYVLACTVDLAGVYGVLTGKTGVQFRILWWSIIVLVALCFVLILFSTVLMDRH